MTPGESPGRYSSESEDTLLCVGDRSEASDCVRTFTYQRYTEISIRFKKNTSALNENWHTSRSEQIC